MAITIEEKFGSRESTTGDGASVDLLYIIRGTDSDLSAKVQLAAFAPATYDGLVRQSLHISYLGPQLWEAAVRYVPATDVPPEVGESTFSFDTGGGSQHVTQSLQTIARYAPAGGSGGDFGGAIGVTQDSVEGVDITVPIYLFSETHYLPDSTVTPGYRGTLFYLTGTVNDAFFKGLNAGECLFLGASGSKRASTSAGSGSTTPEEQWEITYRFAGSPNKAGLTIGPIAGVDKKGWEYLWVRYQDVEDSAANVLVKRPAAVYIEKVYETANFGLLGIGT